MKQPDHVAESLDIMQVLIEEAVGIEPKALISSDVHGGIVAETVVIVTVVVVVLVVMDVLDVVVVVLVVLVVETVVVVDKGVYEHWNNEIRPPIPEQYAHPTIVRGSDPGHTVAHSVWK